MGLETVAWFGLSARRADFPRKFLPQYSEGRREIVIGGRKKRCVLYVQTFKDGVASLGLWQS